MKNDVTERASAPGRKGREEIGKGNQMTTLRFWMGKRHQTSPASPLEKTSDVVLNAHTTLRLKPNTLMHMHSNWWQVRVWLMQNTLTKCLDSYNKHIDYYMYSHIKDPNVPLINIKCTDTHESIKVLKYQMCWCTLIPNTLHIYCDTKCTDDYWHQTHWCVVALSKLVVGHGVLRLRQKHADVLCDTSVVADMLFYWHPSVQNTILLNKVLWSALFLLPGSSYLESTPCFCLPFYLLSALINLP